MLFKRIIKGKSVLNADKGKAPEKCSRRKSECDECGEHSTILEETMKMVLLGVVLWAGVTFGANVAPYPFNFLGSSDVIHPPPLYDYPFPSAENLKKIPTVTVGHTNKSLTVSRMSVDMLQNFERNLASSEVTPAKGSAGHALTIMGRPNVDAMRYEKSSMIITKASQNLAYTRCEIYGLPIDECASFISTLNLRETEYGQECAALERFTCKSNKMSSKYRTFDGSCNNPVRSSWGQALTGYKRLLHPRYADGIEDPRRAASRRPLPSARAVSSQLAGNEDRPEDRRTLALAVWSQLVHHDLAHTPTRMTVHTNQPIRCCEASGEDLKPRYLHPSCFRIPVPAADPQYRHNFDTCMEYTRSVTTYRGDCTFGAAEQMNQASHFLDGSQIYGTNGRDAAALREPTGGLLKTSRIHDEEHLPLAADSADRCLGDGACFVSGDIRSNLHPWLASLHTALVREHNRVARALAALFPAPAADRLYHEARRLVVAQLQHITYRHWLPALTGQSLDDLYEAYDTGYNSDVDPTITNSFATAAFHFVNSLLDNDVTLLDDNNNATVHRLRDHYFKPDIVARKGSVEQILRGMVTQKSQGLDLNYDDDVRQHYLGRLDALALDIQRGRDHGLPGYAQYRALCGLPPAQDFDDLLDVMPEETVAKLRETYAHVHDVDLAVGAAAEPPRAAGLLGPTFTCLIKEQLWRTSAGDRYFYSHPGEAGSFTKRQLAEIKKASLASLLCDNAGLKVVQRDLFRPVSESNPLVPCSEIKRVNLEAWRAAPDLLARTARWLTTKVGGTEQAGNVTK